MKTNHITKLVKALLALSLLTLGFGKAMAQVNLTLEHQSLHASIPGEYAVGDGESF
jgi:hypothetical protein